jgi:glycosyltransferase involved in cell wall biosynthesis
MGARRLLGRNVAEVPAHQIRCFPSFVIRQWTHRIVHPTSPRYQRYAQQNQIFGKMVVRSGFANGNCAYVFNGAGLEILQAAGSQGIPGVVEQTSAALEFDAGLLLEERGYWPDWEQPETCDGDWRRMAEREQKERELARTVICGSDYVRSSLAAIGEDTSHCEVVPYGAPAGLHYRPRTAVRHRKFRVLFAGTLCLRKGLPYFLEAAQRCDSRFFEFRVAGPSSLTARAQQRLTQRIEYVGNVPRRQMQEQFDWADTLVLPSISEGSANVCYEALAGGLPVITTHHAGSVVRDGNEGFLIPLRDSQAIVDRLERLRTVPQLIEHMSEAAFARSSEFTWQHYERRLAEVLQRQFPEFV